MQLLGLHHSVSARQAHDGRPDEQLYFSTLPMNGRARRHREMRLRDPLMLRSTGLMKRQDQKHCLKSTI
jgi:hypothetical protein